MLIFLHPWEGIGKVSELETIIITAREEQRQKGIGKREKWVTSQMKGEERKKESIIHV